MNEKKLKEVVSVNEGVRRLMYGCLFLLAIGYLLQVFSPLRIDIDSYRLLSMAVSSYHGGGYLVDGYVDQFPLAYPFLVKVLLQTHMASSMALVILNLLFLVVGLWVLHTWSKTENGSVSTMLPVVFVLSSFIMVKHVTMPLSELLYFGISLLSLFFLGIFLQQDGRRKWCSFSIATLLGLLALQCRSVGLAILPVLVVTPLLHRDIAPIVARIFAKRRLILMIVCVSVVLLSLAAFIVRQTGWYESQFVYREGYFQSLLHRAQGKSIMGFFLQNIDYRIREFGEVFSNIPSSKAARLLPLQFVFGLMAWCVVLKGGWILFSTRRHPVLLVYFLSYVALMLMWPYYEARFWLPLLPVLAIMLHTGAKALVGRWPIARFAYQSYLVVFFVLGIVAIVFSTRISLSGRDFSELYGDGTSRMTYRYAFRNGRDVDMSQVYQGQVRLLKIFEPLAKSSPQQEQGQ